MGRPFVDRIGERHGRLTVVEYMGVSQKAGHYRLWRCQCDCGAECVVAWRELSRGHTKSCGCLFRETIAASGGWNRKPEGESAFNQLFQQYRRSARGRGYSFGLSEEEFRNLTQLPCYYCGLPPSLKVPTVKSTNGEYLYTGVDRIDNRRGYSLDNVRPCCKQCNIAKGTLSEVEYIDWLSRTSKRLRL
jgi:hypothetical protein